MIDRAGLYPMNIRLSAVALKYQIILNKRLVAFEYDHNLIGDEHRSGYY